MTRIEIIRALVSARSREQAIDSVRVAILAGIDVRRASAFLCVLHKRLRVLRVPTSKRKDKFGRRRMTYAYYGNTRLKC